MDYVKDVMVHQDIAEFAEKLKEKIWNIIEEGLQILREAYVEFENYQIYNGSIESLMHNSKECSCQNFTFIE